MSHSSLSEVVSVPVMLLLLLLQTGLKFGSLSFSEESACLPTPSPAVSVNKAIVLNQGCKNACKKIYRFPNTNYFRYMLAKEKDC